jgi:hypothetical protein
VSHKFYLRDARGHLRYTLVVRDGTSDEERSCRDRACEGVLEIWPRRWPRSGAPALTVVVGAPMCRPAGYVENQCRDVIRAGLAFASEPSAWDDPHERAMSENYGTDASEWALGHGVIGRWVES